MATLFHVSAWRLVGHDAVAALSLALLSNATPAAARLFDGGVFVMDALPN